MAQKYLTASVDFTVEFYEVDSMSIVWHGNYIQYMERARCALLNKIQYNYIDMQHSGYAWPVTGIKVKYIRPLRFLQKACIVANLEEYENCLKISYEIIDIESQEVLTKAESTQMAISIATMESCFVSPKELVDKVKEYVASH